MSSQKDITILTADEIVKVDVGHNIGSEFIITDNILEDIDFERPDYKASLRTMATKTMGHNAIFVCLDGEIGLVSNTKRYTMHRGDVQYVQTGHIGIMEHFSPDCKFILVISKESFYMPNLAPNEAAAFRRELATHSIAHLSDQNLHGIVEIYKMIAGALENRDKLHYVRRTIQGFLQAMTFLVFGAYAVQAASTSEYTSARQEEIYARFLKLVQENYTTERNIAFYADKLCITPKYLSHLIHKASGMYAGEHIDSYVINEAKMLVKSRKFSIAQISDKLNFTSQAYFCRYFKKHTGFTPIEFADKG